MSWYHRLLSLFGIERLTITLKGEKREGGYIFIYSPDLKGFSLLLEPGDYSDFKTFIDAIYGPLLAYLKLYVEARDTARKRQKSLRLYAMKESAPMVAKICFQ